MHQALKLGIMRVFTRNANSFQQTNSLEVYQGDLTRNVIERGTLGVDVVVNAAGEFLDEDAMRLVNFDGQSVSLKLRLMSACSDGSSFLVLVMAKFEKELLMKVGKICQ